jgi:hypothetical protein
MIFDSNNSIPVWKTHISSDFDQNFPNKKATVLTQRARDVDDTVHFRGVILRNPMVCHPKAHPDHLRFDSYIENKDAALLSAAAVHNFVGFYNPPPTDTRFSSLLTDDFTGLPPAYIQISGADPLRDDGVHYVDKLESARYGGVPCLVQAAQIPPPSFLGEGLAPETDPLILTFPGFIIRVPVKVDMYAGLPHAFFVFPLESAKKCNAELLQGVEWLAQQQERV